MTAAGAAAVIRTLRYAAGALLAAAVIAVIWRPPLEARLPDEAAGSLAGDSLTALPTAAAERGGDTRLIIDHNIFATSRRAPSRRYAPDAGAGPAPMADVSAFADPMLGTAPPTLLGTVLQDGNARALLLAPGDSAARFYSVGERVAGFRVRTIESRRVVLVGPTGRIVLDLSKPNEDKP
ncbi:MAG: hypothetical protein ACT4R6_04905 [Gemmatimonadaceae bacterium]